MTLLIWVRPGSITTATKSHILNYIIYKLRIAMFPVVMLISAVSHVPLLQTPLRRFQKEIDLQQGKYNCE